MQARLDVQGFREARTRIDAVGVRARAARPALTSPYTRRDFEQSSGRRFARGLRRDQQDWVVEKARRGLSTSTMEASGDAKEAIVHGKGRRAGDIEFTGNNVEVRFGVKRGRSGLYYLQVHDKGYRTSRGATPKRRVVLMDKKARERISQRVETYVAEGRVHP